MSDIRDDLELMADAMATPSIRDQAKEMAAEMTRCSICHVTHGEHLLSCPTLWYRP